MKIGAIVQARLSSTRLPKKILKDLPFNSGITVLEQVIRRLKKSTLISDIIIATSTAEEDSELEIIAQKENVLFFRGDLYDVLSRYYNAAVKYGLEQIVRITSDCPCIDPEIVDSTIKLHLNEDADYTSNTLERTFPHGLDVEVFSMNSLKKAFKEAHLPSDREHVCPYFYKTNPKIFKLCSYTAKNEKETGPDIRITLDTRDDYVLLCAVYDFLYNINPFFNNQEIIDLFSKHQWLKMMNDSIIQKKVRYTYEEEKLEGIQILKSQGLNKFLSKIYQLIDDGSL